MLIGMIVLESIIVLSIDYEYAPFSNIYQLD